MSTTGENIHVDLLLMGLNQHILPYYAHTDDQFQKLKEIYSCRLQKGYENPVRRVKTWSKKRTTKTITTTTKLAGERGKLSFVSRACLERKRLLRRQSYGFCIVALLVSQRMVFESF